MDLFKMAGIDASDLSANDNQTAKRADAKVTNAVNSSSSSQHADADGVKAANDANDASDERDYQTSDIQYEEATNHDLANVKRERDRIGTAMMIEESILHDLKVQLAMLKQGSDDSDDNVKRISDVKYRIVRIEESIDDMNKQLEQLK